VHRAYHVIPRHPASTEPDLTTAAGLR